MIEVLFHDLRGWIRTVDVPAENTTQRLLNIKLGHFLYIILFCNAV
jgi:hypothetical protein